VCPQAYRAALALRLVACLDYNTDAEVQVGLDYRLPTASLPYSPYTSAVPCRCSTSHPKCVLRRSHAALCRCARVRRVSLDQNVELLKKRLGEASLSQCEVMVRDVEDAKASMRHARVRVTHAPLGRPAPLNFKVHAPQGCDCVTLVSWLRSFYQTFAIGQASTDGSRRLPPSLVVRRLGGN
jgi:hypothetical protein